MTNCSKTTKHSAYCSNFSVAYYWRSHPAFSIRPPCSLHLKTLILSVWIGNFHLNVLYWKHINKDLHFRAAMAMIFWCTHNYILYTSYLTLRLVTHRVQIRLFCSIAWCQTAQSQNLAIHHHSSHALTRMPPSWACENEKLGQPKEVESTNEAHACIKSTKEEDKRGFFVLPFLQSCKMKIGIFPNYTYSSKAFQRYVTWEGSDKSFKGFTLFHFYNLAKWKLSDFPKFHHPFWNFCWNPLMWHIVLENSWGRVRF